VCVCVCAGVRVCVDTFLFCLIFNQHLHVGPIHTWGWMEHSHLSRERTR